MQVTLEEAYAEACRIIGENIVSQRLIAQAEKVAKTEPAQES